jgi:hypothetical protein
MTKRFRTPLLAVGMLSAFLTGQAQAQDFAWETDLAKARAKAKEEGRPLLVVFR